MAGSGAGHKPSGPGTGLRVSKLAGAGVSLR